MTQEEMKDLDDYDLIEKVKGTSYYLPEFMDLLGELLIRFEFYVDRSNEIRMPDGCGRHPLDMD